MKSEPLSEMLAAQLYADCRVSPAHKGPTNTNKMSKFLEERKELTEHLTVLYTSFSFQYQSCIRADGWWGDISRN